MCAQKGRVSTPFWSENGCRLCPFWSGIRYGFQENYRGCINPRWGGTPYDGLYREALSRKGYLFLAPGIWKGRDFNFLMEVYERVGKSVIWVCERAQRANRSFYGFIKSRKRSIFVIDSYLNDSVFTAIKRDAKFKARYVKGVPFVNRRCTKGVPLSWKRVR